MNPDFGGGSSGGRRPKCGGSPKLFFFC